MESARRELRRWEQARIAWGVAAVVCVTALPFASLRHIVLIAAYGGWLVHLVDAKLTAVDERRYARFSAGWTLLAAAVVSSILRLEPTLWLAAPLVAALAWLLWRAWMDVKRA